MATIQEWVPSSEVILPLAGTVAAPSPALSWLTPLPLASCSLSPLPPLPLPGVRPAVAATAGVGSPGRLAAMAASSSGGRKG